MMNESEHTTDPSADAAEIIAKVLDWCWRDGTQAVAPRLLALTHRVKPALLPDKPLDEIVADLGLSAEILCEHKLQAEQLLGKTHPGKDSFQKIQTSTGYHACRPRSCVTS